VAATSPQARVAELSHTPVKGTRLAHPAGVDVDEHGVCDDRLFHVVAAASGKQLDVKRNALARVESAWDRESGRLVLRLPGRPPVEAPVDLGEPVTGHVPWDGMRPVRGHAVLGPFSAALSEHLGEPVALVQVSDPGRGIDVAPLTLVSAASIERLERELGHDGLGSARFRMNLVIDGVGEHEEDEWYGRRVRVGDCVLRVTGPVPRCVAVTRDPATAERDADTLRAIVAYRPPITVPGAAEAVSAPFGVYAEVERAGRIGVSDAVALAG
jgi:hypothetical protein